MNKMRLKDQLLIFASVYGAIVTVAFFALKLDSLRKPEIPTSHKFAVGDCIVFPPEKDMEIWEIPNIPIRKIKLLGVNNYGFSYYYDGHLSTSIWSFPYSKENALMKVPCLEDKKS